MKKDRVYDIINENINDVLLERRKNLIKKILKEELINFFKKEINEEEDNKQKRNFVLTSLKKDGVKKSDLAYALWPNSDPDTARSLLSRKEKNGEWHFDEEEINKLYQLIRRI